jgi:hypothetical protein
MFNYSHYTPKHFLVLILGGFFTLYLLTIGGELYSSDAQAMYETGRALAFQQSLFLPESYGLPQIYQTSAGRWVSQYDLGLPLLAAPLIWSSDGLGAWQAWNRYAFSAYLLAYLPALASAAGLAWTADLAQELGAGRRETLWMILAAGLASPVWVYGRQFFAEGVLVGCLVGAVWSIHRGGYWGAGLALGLGIAIRLHFILYLPIFLYYAWRVRGGGWKLLAGPLLALSLLAYHNFLRHGEPFQLSYPGQGFSTAPWYGVLGLLLSPDKSLFLFCPPLLLSFYAWPAFWRQHRVLAEMLLLMSLGGLVFFGAWWAWGGGWCWGPRFLVPLYPLWCLPLAWLEGKKWPLGGLILLGMGFNILGILSNVNAHYARFMLDYDPFRQSALLGALHTLRAGQVESFGTWHLAGLGWPPGLATIYPLFCLCIGLLCGWQLVRWYRDGQTANDPT